MEAHRFHWHFDLYSSKEGKGKEKTKEGEGVKKTKGRTKVTVVVVMGKRGADNADFPPQPHQHSWQGPRDVWPSQILVGRT